MGELQGLQEEEDRPAKKPKMSPSEEEARDASEKEQVDTEGDAEEEAGEEEFEEAAREDEDEIGRRPRSAPAPKLPSQAEVDEHELTHVPFRNWCVHCQRGKARRRRHLRSHKHKVKKAGEPGLELPIVSVDYMYMEVD